MDLSKRLREQSYWDENGRWDLEREKADIIGTSMAQAWLEMGLPLELMVEFGEKFTRHYAENLVIAQNRPTGPDELPV